MTVLAEQERTWISEVAGRLWLIQADAAAAAPEKSREFLNEEIARHLKPVPPAQRKRYLEALLCRFPVAGQVVKLAPTAPPAPVRVAESPDQLLERFLGVAAGLPLEKRAEFLKRLAEAGLAPTPPTPVSAPIPANLDELRKALGLAAGQQLRLDRLEQLGILLVDMVRRLNDRAADAVRDLSKSLLPDRSSDFRQTAARFLTGEIDSLDAQVKVVASLLGTVLVALQRGGKDFGRHYLNKYSPSAILEVIESEKQFGVLFWQKTKDECCWNKYVDLAKEISTPDMIDREIKERLAEFVKRTGLGGQPSS